MKAGKRLLRSVSLILIFGIVLVTRYSFRAAAAEAESDTSANTMPEVVVRGREDQDKVYKPAKLSSTKYTEPLRDVPQTVTVVPQAVIQEQGATTLREVLRNAPGISMQAGEGGVPAGDNLSIRGYNARTDLFVDNVRDFGGYSRDSFNLQQVEIAKGPSSAYGGRGSTGGSINLVSKSPSLDDFNTANVGYGTDQYERYTVDVNHGLEEVGLESTALRLNLLYHYNHTPDRDIAKEERWGIAPTIAFGLEGPTRLILSYFHLDQDNIPDYGIPWVPNTHTLLASHWDKPAPVDFSNYYGLVNRDFEQVETDIATIKIEHDINESLLLTNVTRWGRTYRDSLITAPRFNDTTTSLIRRSDWKSRDQVSDILANQTDLTSKFATSWIEHTLVTGIELIRETDTNYNRNLSDNGLTTDLYNPDPYQPFSGSLFRNGTLNAATGESFAVYGFDTMQLSEQWEFNGGLRWDYFSIDYRPSTGTDLERVDRMLSWRSGIVYKPVEIGSVYAAYGTSFNPSGEGLTLSSAANNAANLMVDPEETESYEIGTKWDLFDERALFNFAIFRTDKSNARTEDPTDSTDIVVLTGEQRVEGFEVGVAGDLTDEWQLFAGYTYLVSEILETKNRAEAGNELSNTPKNTFSLWTTYDLPLNWEIGGGVQFIDDRFSANNNARTAPSYWLTDLMLGYILNDNITIRMNVYNLTDEEYIDRVGGGHFIPGPGRSLIVSTNFEF